MSNFIIVPIFVLVLTGCSLSGNAERGLQIFGQGQADAPPCSTCHQTVSGQVGFSVGPNLAGIAERAGMRVGGLTAEEYLRQSVLEPGRYIVSGYRNMMYADYDSYLTDQNIQDLIAYLLTL